MADRDDRRGADGERGSAGEAGKGGGAGGGKGGRPGRKGEGRGRKGGRPGRKGGAGRKGDRPGRRGGGPRGKGVRAPGRRGPARGRPAGPRPIVAVFAKAPEPGRVKTRLTPALHAQEAADLHRALLQDTVERAERSGAETVVAFAPADARRPLERLLGRHRRLVPQGPGDLGARLDHAFERLCDGRRPVVVVGSDCPAVDEARLRQAFDALRRADVVVGPALDGGYYLIGAKERRPELFRDVPWGTERVLEATRARIEAVGLEAAWLPAARDLDTPADLFEWYAGARAAKLRERYPRTWSVLHSILPPRRFSALEAVVRGDEAG